MESELSNRGLAEGGADFGVPLLVTAAHELKSPLALMRQLALDIESGDVSMKEARRLAHQMALISERALRLTTNLTKQARLEDSFFTIEPLNLLSICDEVISEIKPLYSAHGRQLKVVGRRRSTLGLANKDLLRRILLGFFDNALHYGERSEPVQVSVSMIKNGGYIRLGVRDFGPAIARDSWQKIAKSIGTDRQIMHSRPESSGLGIYIASQFAAAMQAEIGATRHRDGATFYIDLHVSRQLRLL